MPFDSSMTAPEIGSAVRTQEIAVPVSFVRVDPDASGIERRAIIQRIVNAAAVTLFGALGALAGVVLVVLMLVALVIPTTMITTASAAAIAAAAVMISLWFKRRAERANQEATMEQDVMALV